MNNLTQPKTNIQEILYTIITQGHVSIFDFPYLSGFRTRVSELSLKHNLRLNSEQYTRRNKFGNTYTYVIHILNNEDKETAIELYKKISKGK